MCQSLKCWLKAYFPIWCVYWSEQAGFDPGDEKSACFTLSHGWPQTHTLMPTSISPSALFPRRIFSLRSSKNWCQRSMMSHTKEYYHKPLTKLRLPAIPFSACDDCNSLQWGERLQLIGSLQSNIQHGMLDHSMDSLHEVQDYKSNV